MNNNVYIQPVKQVVFDYKIPPHLRGIKDIQQLRQADLELLDAELKKNGSSLEEKISKGIIWRMGFPNMILDVSELHYQNAQVSLIVSPIHPHRADLAYKQDKTLPRNVSPLTANAVLRDYKGNFVIAVRGGSVESGKIGVIPGGHTDYTIPPISDPIDTFRAEFEEELGYKCDSKKDLQILGVFSNKDSKGVHILYMPANTELSFPQILEKWRTAKDRGEHNLLLEASPRDLEQLAETGKLKRDGKEYLTTPLFQDCFRLVAAQNPTYFS